MLLRMKILIIEDDRDIADLIAHHLTTEKIPHEIVHNGAAGLAKARRILPDLILLDLMLPDMGGLEICRALKGDAKTAHIPIILVTAKGEEIDRVVGFEMGADDYMTKPFSPRELLLRVKAVLKRTLQKNSQEKSSEEGKQFGKLWIDPVRYEVKVDKKEIKLTPLEFKLLKFFFENPGRVLTRDKLLDQVWGYDAALTTRTVDTHIKRLRERLGSAGDYIETVRGVGYRLRERVL